MEAITTCPLFTNQQRADDWIQSNLPSGEGLNSVRVSWHGVEIDLDYATLKRLFAGRDVERSTQSSHEFFLIVSDGITFRACRRIESSTPQTVKL
jgi:hypothetical protein